MKYLFLLLLFFSCTANTTEVNKEKEFEELRVQLESYMSQLNGEWVGKISSLELQGDYPKQPFTKELTILIHDDKVLIEFKDSKEWYDSGYDFKIIRYKTHAIIYAYASDKGWVEAFNFTVTLGNIDELNLVWSRAVSNYMVKPSKWESRGYFQGFSILKRKQT